MPDWDHEIRRRLKLESEGQSPDEAAVIQELADHLQDVYSEQRAGGASEREAIDTALAELGDRDRLTATWEALRRPEPPPPISQARSRAGFLGDLWRDVRYGARMLRRNPGFTAIAVLTLALGIGANTTVFTVINTILLNPLPVARQSELAAILSVERARDDGGGGSGSGFLPLSYLNLQDVQGQNGVFSSVAGFSSPLAMTSLNGNAPERVFAELVTANYFETLGLRPVLGRFFLPEEDRTPGTHPVAVISYATWQQRFAAAPDVIGRPIRINRVVFTIVGVGPEGFKGVSPVFGPDLWMPSMMTEQVVPAQMRTWLRDRSAAAFYAVGRLKPGVLLPQADAAMQALAASLARAYPDANQQRGLTAHPLTRAAMIGAGQPAAIFGSAVLLAIVGIILVIACSNVANLLLARNSVRRSEIALRLALGAGRGRLVRQLLTESVLLGLLSGVAGIAIAYAGSQLLWSFRPPEFAKNLVDVAIDWRVLLFGLIVSALTGLVFGAAPAWQSARASLVDALKEEARTAGRSRRRVSLGNALIVGQVALSLVSLVAAGLCLRGMQKAQAVDPGFESDRMGVILMSPGQAGYDRARTEQFYRDARARISAIPGVAAMSWATNLPLFARPSRSLFIEGQDQQDPAGAITPIVTSIDLDYFATSGIRVTRGREFTDADRDGTLPVAMINETMAARYWPNQDAVGRRFRFAGETGYREIVGVTRTANYQALGETPQACVYLPLRQNFSDQIVLYVRTAATDPAPVLGAVQREIRSLDNQIDVADVRTIRTVLSHAMFGATMGVGLLGVFGALGLGLASLGLYGVMAYSVSLRQREMGVRMALGAGQGSVQRLVLREGLRLVFVGIVAGLIGSLMMGGALSRVLYGVSAFDLVSFVGAAIVLLAAAAVACYLPARRASRLDPLTALREG